MLSSTVCQLILSESRCRNTASTSSHKRAVSSTRKPGRDRGNADESAPHPPWEKIAAEKENEPERQNAKRHEANREQSTVFQGRFQQLLVAAAEVSRIHVRIFFWNFTSGFLLSAARCSCPRMMNITIVGMIVREIR